MRSPIGPFLVLVGLATTVILVLLLFQTMGLRGDLEATRAELATLQSQVAEQDDPVTDEGLVQRLDELETRMAELIVSSGADGGDGTPAGSPPDAGGTDTDEIIDRVDQVLERIEALDNRIDEICEGVPVC